MKIRQRIIGLCVMLLIPGGAMAGQTAYDFSFEGLENGQRIELSAFKNKPILLVNTASQCGFTPQYRQLEEIYKKYGPKGLVVVGVPSNDFGSQEPGSNEDIKNFCQLNYGVTFPMTSKQIVKGDNAHPFYLWAREVLGDGSAPRWNFHKYLIGRDGRLIDYFGSTTRPDNEKITKLIEKELTPQ